MTSLIETNRVLVPTDFSKDAMDAQAKTLDFVGDASHLYILHVLPSLWPGEPGITWNTVDDDTRKANVEKTFREQCSGPEYEGVHFEVKIGDPSSEIIDFAGANDINLIVIPSHGRTGMKRFLMGSVADRIVRFAKCPVLVLHRSDSSDAP
ncbi:MAG: universal stress protein [Elainellaceae cyanobacterium]